MISARRAQETTIYIKYTILYIHLYFVLVAINQIYNSAYTLVLCIGSRHKVVFQDQAIYLIEKKEQTQSHYCHSVVDTLLLVSPLFFYISNTVIIMQSKI